MRLFKKQFKINKVYNIELHRIWKLKYIVYLYY